MKNLVIEIKLERFRIFGVNACSNFRPWSNERTSIPAFNSYKRSKPITVWHNLTTNYKRAVCIAFALGYVHSRARDRVKVAQSKLCLIRTRVLPLSPAVNRQPLNGRLTDRRHWSPVTGSQSRERYAFCQSVPGSFARAPRSTRLRVTSRIEITDCGIKAARAGKWRKTETRGGELVQFGEKQCIFTDNERWGSLATVMADAGSIL